MRDGAKVVGKGETLGLVVGAVVVGENEMVGTEEGPGLGACVVGSSVTVGS